MRSGDIVTGEGGERWELGPLLAYQGGLGCTNRNCTRLMRRGPDGMWDGECVGWHCSRCNEPCSSLGHRCPSDN